MSKSKGGLQFCKQRGERRQKKEGKKCEEVHSVHFSGIQPREAGSIGTRQEEVKYYSVLELKNTLNLGVISGMN